MHDRVSVQASGNKKERGGRRGGTLSAVILGILLPFAGCSMSAAQQREPDWEFPPGSRVAPGRSFECRAHLEVRQVGLALIDGSLPSASESRRLGARRSDLALEVDRAFFPPFGHWIALQAIARLDEENPPPPVAGLKPRLAKGQDFVDEQVFTVRGMLAAYAEGDLNRVLSIYSDDNEKLNERCFPELQGD
jgi:hypothetical protein